MQIHRLCDALHNAQHLRMPVLIERQRLLPALKEPHHALVCHLKAPEERGTIRFIALITSNYHRVSPGERTAPSVASESAILMASARKTRSLGKDL